MYKKLVIFFILIIPKLVYAQLPATNHVKDLKKISELDGYFIHEVKQVDEFIDRFNNDSTQLQDLLAKLNMPKLSRANMIKGLFNYSKPGGWNTNDIAAFVKQVDNKEAPIFLNFLDDKWFANVTCSVLWEGKPKVITLKLKVQKDGNSSLKWVIFDIDADFLSVSTTKIPQPNIPTPVSADAYLNPISHNLNFFSIDMVTSDTKNIANYLASTLYYSNNFIIFINQCLTHKVKIQSVRKVTYNFQQIKGWDFQLEQFIRPSDNNSGWLINKLTRVPS